MSIHPCIECDDEVSPCKNNPILFIFFMSILMLSHLFLYYFILLDLNFIPILPDRENSASILIVLPLF